jgi:hypothetical protein
MTMTKPRALLLAVFTVWPFIYMFLFIGFVFTSMFWIGPGRHNQAPDMFMAVMALHLLTMLEMFALLVIYMVHLFKTPAVRQDMKALWAVVLFLGNMLAMPVYWYLYIWRPLDQPPAASAA